MVAQADLEKKVARLKDRIQKAGEGGERPLPPDRLRRFRRRLKRTQRKLAAKAVQAARTQQQAKTAEAAKSPAEEQPAEAKAAPEEQSPAETSAEEAPAEETS